MIEIQQYNLTYKLQVVAKTKFLKVGFAKKKQKILEKYYTKIKYML